MTHAGIVPLAPRCQGPCAALRAAILLDRCATGGEDAADGGGVNAVGPRRQCRWAQCAGARMTSIAMDAWIADQEERRKTGFAYVDIRCHPYDIPDK